MLLFLTCTYVSIVVGFKWGRTGMSIRVEMVTLAGIIVCKGHTWVNGLALR